MKLALECPTALLPVVQPFGDLDWVVAPRVLQDKEYAEFYHGSARIKVLSTTDGIAEPLGLEDFKKALDAIGGNAFVVAPNWANDMPRTVSAYGEWRKEFGEGIVIGVLQGSSFKEALSCLNWYKGEVAVPYDIGSSGSAGNWLMGLRRALVVSNIPADRFVHLLGFNTVEELEWYETKPNILSINTGYPVALGLAEEDILDTDKLAKKEPTAVKLDRFKGELTQTQWTAVIRNIALLRKHLS